MKPQKDSLAAALLRRLAEAVHHYPRFFFYAQVILFVAAVGCTVRYLKFNESRNDLVGSDKKYHQNFLKFREEFAGEDDLVAVVESGDRERNRQFVERLGRKLEAETNLFTDVFYKGDLTMMGRKALLFFPEDTLQELRDTLRNYRPFLEEFSKATNLNALFRQVNYAFRTSGREQNAKTDSMVESLPALGRIIDQAGASLDRPGNPPSPGITTLFNAGAEAESQQYITFAEGRIYLVSARARSGEVAREALERLRALVAATQQEVPGLNVGVTGEPVLEIDEMAQSQKDSTVASIVSLVACALIFIFGYQQTGRPLKATVCLLVGLGLTMGYTTATVGQLNILTVTFFPILIGLAIDFGVHLITRYEEELRHGTAQKKAMEKAMVNTGLGIFTGCFTTAGAFFAMALTDFKGIQEMGIITGGGMLICLVPMMTLLPVLLRRGRQNAIDHARHGEERRARLEKRWLSQPWRVMAIMAAVTAVCATQIGKVYFDYNLLNMQSRGLPAVVFEEKLIDSASKSVLYAAIVADTVEDAVKLQQKLEKLPSVASIDSMAAYLAQDSAQKLRWIDQIKQETASIHFPEISGGQANIDELSQTLFYTQSYLGTAIAEVQKEQGQDELLGRLRDVRQSISDFRHRLSRGNEAQDAPKLASFERALFEDIRNTFDTLKNQDSAAGLSVEDLPSALRHRFIGKTGKHLLQVYPKHNIWERKNQEEFITELRQAVGEGESEWGVTGTPVQLYEYTTLLKESYQKAAWYALGAISVLTLIHFRSLVSVLLALLPVGIGMVWLLGVMGFFDIPFNPANIMILPLVAGIGVTNGIHILNRFAEEKNPAILGKSTGKAVLVSGMTTIAGFGSLIPAQHQGIASLGLVMSIGVATCMIAALLFLPGLITLLMRAGWNAKKEKTQ